MKDKTFPVILSLVIFLAAQAFGNVHAAEYGAEKHKHRGLVCDIYLSSEQAKSAALPPPLVPSVLGYSSIVFGPPVSIVLPGAEHLFAFPRAPPSTLLS